MIEKKVAQQITRNVEKSFDEQISFLSDLVRCKTLVGHEGDGQTIYADGCRRLGSEPEGFLPDKAVVSQHPAYNESGKDFAGRPNIISILPARGRGRSLILNGHMDVVSPEPLASWTFDPWTPRVKDGFLYGQAHWI